MNFANPEIDQRTPDKTFMSKKQKVPVIIEDNKNLKNILVQLDMAAGHTKVISKFSAWENIAYLMEALGASAQQCLREGRSKQEVYEEINRYLARVLIAYDIDGDNPLKNN